MQSPEIFFGDHDEKNMYVILGGRDEVLNDGSTCAIKALSGGDSDQEVTMRPLDGWPSVVELTLQDFTPSAAGAPKAIGGEPWIELRGLSLAA